jgi:hypothetical protein
MQRQYEALRAFYMGNEKSAEVAARFGYTPGYFRVLCHEFRTDPNYKFFRPVAPGRKRSSESEAIRELIIGMRKQNLSVYDIEDELKRLGHKKVHVSTIRAILQEEGFARLPRRDDEERPSRPHPLSAAVANVREFSCAPRGIHSRVAGLFLLLPHLVSLDLDAVVKAAKLPGTRMIPAGHAVRSALALKLIGTERKSHVGDLIFDEGLSLFAGLNVLPKKSFLSEYSGRVDHKTNLQVLTGWLNLVAPDDIDGQSFNLDFHSVPYFGEDEFMEKHYVSMRSRRQKSVLTFLAQDSATNLFCYFNADVRKGEENDEVLAFVEYWKKTTGAYPRHLAFDSKLTTYANLNRLNKQGIQFVTLRRRDKAVLADIAATPASAWQRVELDLPQRKFSTPRVIDKTVTLTGYTGTVRQLFITDLGHEQPTVLLANDTKSSVRQLITRYAQRTLIENTIAESIDFFHLNALSSAVAMKVDFDVLLTVLAMGLYRRFAKGLRGYERAMARQLFRKFIDTPGDIEVTEDGVTVWLPKRAHNPILIAAGVLEAKTEVPWWGGKKLQLRLS